ncbi:UDP-glycosyltransferase 89B2-like [Panicum miliaceum]|uniref:UDP-glycosyltransferase 89B2-like n=1 Tax=Panicum miliaceum TaxID=4540 RepID=A0A3L6PET3_PANMI|nr:UDP-glycosyltransferase 89B2-like [Panicum miliaceum]
MEVIYNRRRTAHKLYHQTSDQVDNHSTRTSAAPNMAVVAPGQAASGSTTGAPHVLVVPYPAQGHMQPLLHLASLLAARGLRLTVVATPATVRLLAPLVAEHPASVRLLTFPSAADHDTSGPTSVGADFHAVAALRGPSASGCGPEPIQTPATGKPAASWR